MASAGCASMYNPATGKNEFIFINSATEAAIGDACKDELFKKQPLLKDPEREARVKRIGARLAAASDRKDIEYKFYVLDDKELNAVTLPGGLIYINMGLMDILNDDEVAYVLGHETGHVAARHIAKKLQANMAYQALLAVAFTALGDKAEAGKTGANVITGADTVFSLVGLKYSRNDEYEADRLGVKYSYSAGFDPNASLTALEKIKKEEGPNWKVLEYFRTHPYVDERIKALKELIPKVKNRQI